MMPVDKRHPENLLPMVCDNLRAKEFYLEGLQAPQMRESGPETAYWCLSSMQAFGPDGDYCCPESCDSKRPCYVE